MNGYCTVGRSYMLSLLGVRVKGLRVLFVLQSKWTIPTVPPPPTPHPPPLVFIVEIPWSLNYLWSIFHFRPIAIFFLFLFFFGIFFFFQLSFCFILGCDNLAQCQDSCGNYAAYLSFILVSNTEFHQPITPQHQYEFSPNYTFPLVPTWRIHLTIKAS